MRSAVDDLIRVETRMRDMLEVARRTEQYMDDMKYARAATEHVLAEAERATRRLVQIEKDARRMQAEADRAQEILDADNERYARMLRGTADVERIIEQDRRRIEAMERSLNSTSAAMAIQEAAELRKRRIVQARAITDHVQDSALTPEVDESERRIAVLKRRNAHLEERLNRLELDNEALAAMLENERNPPKRMPPPVVGWIAPGS